MLVVPVLWGPTNSVNSVCVYEIFLIPCVCAAAVAATRTVVAASSVSLANETDKGRYASIAARLYSKHDCLTQEAYINIYMYIYIDISPWCAHY